MRILLLCLAGVVLSGCGRTDACDLGPVWMSGPTFMRGLWDQNQGEAPAGSAHTADNVAIYENGVWQRRHGFSQWASTVSGAINRLVYFDGYWIAHHGSSSISRTTDGTSWTAYSGTFSPPDASTKVTFEKASGSLFVTTSLGVYELDDAVGTWRQAGAPPALDSTATLRRTSNETGFATANGQWAYRVVWGIENANGRIWLGRTSGRFLVQNPANITAQAANISKAGSAVVTVTATTHGFATGEYVDVTITGDANFTSGRFQVTVASSTQFTYNDGGATPTASSTVNGTYGFTSRNVSVAIPIPSGITTSHFVQVYRSAKSASATTEPDDVLGLVAEESPTNLEITAGSLTITDQTTDDLRDGLIYTSLLDESFQKDQPPHCRTQAYFEDCMFYGCIHGLHVMELSLLAVGGSAGLAVDDFIIFQEGQALTGWAFGLTGKAAENAASGQFKVYTDGTASQNIANTAKSLVRILNAYTTNTTLYAQYVSGHLDAPGRMRFYARTPAVAAFSAYVAAGDDYFAPRLPGHRGITSIARTGGTTVTVDTNGSHGFATGQQIIVVGPNANFPSGTKTITVVDADTFTYTESGSNVSAADGATFDISAATVLSNNDDRDWGVMYSDIEEPGSVPLKNLILVGTGSVTKFTKTDRELQVWTTAGLFAIRGYADNFYLDTIDPTSRTVAYDTPAAVAGVAVGWTDRGVIDSRFTTDPVSRPIKRTLEALQALAPSDYGPDSFGVSYDQEGLYLMFVPDAAGETDADHAYVLQTKTGDWTKWAIDKATAAYVSEENGKLYVGRSDGSVWEELKARSHLDYKDPGASFTITNETFPVLTLNSVSGLAVGDSLYQASSGARDIITAISGNDVTVEGITAFAFQEAAVVQEKSIPTVIEPLSYDAGSLGEKQWTAWNVRFTDPGSYWGQGTMKTWSDLAQGTTDAYSDGFTVSPKGWAAATSYPAGQTVLSGRPDADRSRGSLFRWRFEHSRANELWAIESWTMDARQYAERSGR